ncbi:MAG: DNA repair protein RecN [Burkholderiales bacterium]
MLRQLSLRDFVIVDELDLAFDSGFTVLTGETGAGKSILVDALALALGGRGDAGIVRTGATRAEISAEFDISALRSMQVWLGEQELDDENNCLMRRVIDSGGRSRCFINGRAVSTQQLREAGEFLVDIHGQHAHQSLLKAAVQRDLLDGYGGCGELAREVALRYRAWRQAWERLSALRQNSSDTAAEREQLLWQLEELEALKFDPEEWNALQAEHKRLAYAVQLGEGAGFALEAISEGDTNAASLLHNANTRLSAMVDYDSALSAIVDLVESAAVQIQEASHSLRQYTDKLDADPARLTEVEQRIGLVLDMARKYRVKADAFPDLLASVQQRLQKLSDAEDVAGLEEEVEGAHREWLRNARQLSAARISAAGKLAQHVSNTMQQLALSGGRFDIVLTEQPEESAYGLEQAEFLVSTHQGVAPKALAKVASGGELSRISLALQTAVSQVAGVPTLIFDEVDVGIGGGVAEIVGRMLKDLAASRQILCITHLPQVAAVGEHHLQVSKVLHQDAVVSRIVTLAISDRVDEIARMLGGVTITDTTRQHAREMLG